MKALQAYIEQKNRWNAIFKGEQFEIQSAKVVSVLLIASMLTSALKILLAMVNFHAVSCKRSIGN